MSFYTSETSKIQLYCISFLLETDELKPVLWKTEIFNEQVFTGQEKNIKRKQL